MQLVGKLSVKTVVGSVPTIGVEVPKMQAGQPVIKEGVTVMETVQRGVKQNLMRVFGQCDKTKPIVTNFGESTEFQGQFEATNALTGEVFRSTKLFLPPLVEGLVKEQVEGALLAAEKAAAEAGTKFDGKAGVQFAFDIGADSANNAHGYQYTIVPLTAPSQADPLALMKAALLGNAPALQIAGAAPTETPASAMIDTEQEASEAAASKTKTKK
jgi:hypothetical protein